MTKEIWIMIILYIMSEHVISDLTGPNVCQEEQEYKVNVTKYVLRNVTVRSYTWCLQVPPRCSTYSAQQINHTKFEEERRIRSVGKCCDGFYELNENTCLPNSCKFCQHGRCDEFGVCSCESGYWGDKCDQECTVDNWNGNCERDCTNCTEGHCDISMGNCTVCSPKFVRCDLICSEGHKYSECLQRCGCNSMTACDPITNKCEPFQNTNTTAGKEKYEYLNNVLVKNKTGDDNLGRNVVNLSDFATDSSQSVNLYYATTKSFNYSDLEATVPATEKNEKKPISQRKVDYAATIANIADSTFAEKKINFKLKLSEIDKTNNNIVDPDENARRNTNVFENKTNEKHTLHTTNYTSHSVVIDGHLFTTIISAGLFTVLTIVTAAVFCVLHKLKVKRKKYIEAVRNSVDNGKEDIKLKVSTPSLSVTARSIFHTPLPEPPVFENPAFIAQFETTQNKQPGILETQLICNVSMPKTTNHDQSKQEFFYDHPPSTGKYRVASLPEPPNSNCGKIIFDPIYDEIPCHQRAVPVSSPQATYKQEQSILYMNTK